MQRFKFLLSIGVIVALILMSIFANYLATYDPNQIDILHKLQPPSPQHWFGTDALGRDLYSRIVYGGRTSMIVAFFAVLCSMLFGLIMGAIAGFYGGIFDWIISYFANIFQGIPNIAFMIAITGVFGFGVKPLLIGLFFTSWAGFSRIVRMEVMEVKKEPYIEAMRGLGCNDFQLIAKHIIPNILGNITTIFTTTLGRSLLTISALSYIGLGITPPTADWSVMINDAKMNYRSAPYLIIIPGIFIFLLIFSINTLGDGLRDKFDKKSGEIDL